MAWLQSVSMWYLISEEYAGVGERARQLQRVRVGRAHVGHAVDEVQRVARHVVRALRRVRLHVALVVHRRHAQDALREGSI